MPRISEFFGIIIAMYYNDHSPPHFHARYGESEATIAIESLRMLDGTLPRRVQTLVREWAMLHGKELSANWERARQGKPLKPIRPLD